MPTILLILLSAVLIASPSPGQQLNDKKLPSDSVEIDCAPGCVFAQFFELLEDADQAGSEAMFRAHSEEQRAAVRKYVKGGIGFLKHRRITNTVIATYQDGDLAMCAIRQASPEYPDNFELEYGCLMLDGDVWRLLPQPQYYRGKLNGLSEDNIAAFDELKKKFIALKSAQSHHKTNKG